MSYLKTLVQTNPFTTAAYSFQERQNRDSIGPITVADGQKIHILVAFCCFTRWVEIWVTDAVTDKAAHYPPSIKALIDKVHGAVVGHHGVELTFSKLVEQGHHWPYMREHVKY